MRINYCLKLSLSFLSFCLLVGASATIHAQQKEQTENSPGTEKKNACTNGKRAKFNVKCKDRYFLGEIPTIAIMITNTNGSPKTVKEAEHQKFSLEMTGVFRNDTGQQKTRL